MSDVVVVMGSQSDFPSMRLGFNLLCEFGVSCDVMIVSAHRTPDRLFKFASDAEHSGVKVIIAGAGGAAHLPGMIASMTCLPVIGVPMFSRSLNGLDSLLSIVQMPCGVPVATMSIGDDGACNAALYAVSILAVSDVSLRVKLSEWKRRQSDAVKLRPE